MLKHDPPIGISDVIDKKPGFLVRLANAGLGKMVKTIGQLAIEKREDPLKGLKEKVITGQILT